MKSGISFRKKNRLKTGKNFSRHSPRRKFLAVLVLSAAAVLLCVFIYRPLRRMLNPDSAAGEQQKLPPQLLLSYMNLISEKEYETMYDMLDLEASGYPDKEDFIKRNSSIYEGIAMQDMEIEIIGYDKEQETVSYRTSFDTAAGAVSFENEALFFKQEDGYGLVWQDSLIFPELRASDKVRVSTVQAKRGDITDRNGVLLAGWGTAASAGIVPGKLQDRKQAVAEIAELLEMEPEAVMRKLEAKWVKDDSFVPIKTIPAVREIDLLSEEPDKDAVREKKRQEQLLEIPGVMITETSVRHYPLKQAASHLTGYIQNVTAEDLEEHAGEGYTANSVIGRSGIEGLFEKELKGSNGCRIYIADADGKARSELAEIPVQHGQDIRLTIDAGLQQQLYEQFQEDKSCSVAMNPFTGEVLVLASTPSYDSNDFIMGMSSQMWTALNEDENRPLYNRFRQKWCPGSTFKPVIAAIGLETGSIDPQEDFGNEGLSWQNGASWGGYFVTTLHVASPSTMENALICSDNIYFAKAALKIGADRLETFLQKLGFGTQMPFEINMAQAQYANEGHMEDEIQLADSGYGQGQVLISPLHLASVYTAFCNSGTVLKPYLVYKPKKQAQEWIPDAFSEQTAQRVLEGLKKIVNYPQGTGFGLHRDDRLLAGKTGTAEIKASKDDHTGTELGWMAVMTPDKSEERPVLIVSMAEDVKGRGGSGYAVARLKEVLGYWFEQDQNVP